MKKLWTFLVICIGLCTSSFSLFPSPANHLETPDEVAFLKISRSVAKTYDLKLLTVGSSACITTDSKEEYSPWGVRFASEKRCTLEEGRALAKTICSLILDAIQKDPRYAAYYQRREMNTVLSINDLALKIAFWSKEVERYSHPYLAEIRLVKGNLHFYYKEPHTPALGEPLIEKLDYSWEKPS